MTINDVTIQADRTEFAARSRRPTRKVIVISATALVVASVALAGVVQNSRHETSQPAANAAPTVDAPSRDDVVRDLVDRGLVPAQTLEVASPTRDDVVRDLVNRDDIPTDAMNRSTAVGFPMTASPSPSLMSSTSSSIATTPKYLALS